MKEFVTSLYSYEFEPQEKYDTDDEDEIDFIIDENKSNEEEDSEVVKPKKIEKTFR